MHQNCNATYSRVPIYLKLPVARYCMLPSICLVRTVVCTIETYKKECCVCGYLPTCDLAANMCAACKYSSLQNNFRAINSHGWNRPRNIFNNKSTDKCKLLIAGSKVANSSTMGPTVLCSSEVLCTHNTTSSTNNHCPSALQCCQCLLNGTPCGYLCV